MIALLFAMAQSAPPAAADPRHFKIVEPARLLSGAPTVADYPKRALKREAQGVSEAEVRVSAQGRVTSCFTVKTAGDPDLDAATCRVALTRMKFAPARNSFGKPIDQRLVLPIRWSLGL